MNKSAKRSIWLVFGAGCTVLLIALIFHPWMMLRTGIWLMGREGATAESWEVEGYREYVLHGVTHESEAGGLRVQTVRVRQPVNWFWSVIRAVPQDEPFLLGVGWHFEPSPQAAPPPEEQPPVPVPELYRTLLEFEPAARRWAGWIELQDGRITAEAGEVHVSLVRWKEGRMDMAVQIPAEGVRASLSGPFGGPWELDVEADRFPEAFRMRALPAIVDQHLEVKWESELAAMRGRGVLYYLDEQVSFYPNSGHIRLHIGEFDGAEVGLPQLQLDRGEFEARWEELEWRAEGNVFGAWLEGEYRLPVELRLRAEGNPERAHLQELRAQAPWLVARLDRPITWSISERRFEEDFTLSVIANLDTLGFEGLAGRLQGIVQPVTDPRDGRVSQTEFQLEAERAVWGDYAIEAFGARGRVRYPEIQIDDLIVRLPHGSALTAQGAFDVEPLAFSDVTVSGSVYLEDFAGAGDFRTAAPIQFQGRIDGVGAAIRHEGTARTEGLELPALHPMDVTVEWLGEELDSVGFRIDAVQAEGDWQFQGAATRMNDSGWSVRLERAAIRSADADLWRLSRESTIVWRADEPDAWRITIDDLEWSGGPDGTVGQVRADWRAAGPLELSLDASAVEIIRFQPLLKIPLPDAVLHRVAARIRPADGDGSALDWSVEVDAALRGYPLPANERIQLAFAAGGDAGGVQIDRASIVGRTESFLEGSGVIPVSLAWRDGAPALQIVPDREADVQIRLVSRPSLVRLVRAYTGIDLGDPQIAARVQGRPDRPTGRIGASFGSLAVPGLVAGELGRIENLIFELSLEPGGITVERCRFQFHGELFELTGSLPMRVADWRAMWEERVLPDWTRASAQVLTERFRVESIALFLPEVLARTGHFRATLNMEPGPEFHGFLEVRGAATRPLPMGTSLREINGRIEFHGTRAELSGFSAHVERHPVMLSGWVDFSEFKDPDVDLRLQGCNVPILRQPDLMVRGDADISFKKMRGQPAVLSGNLRLHDSILMREFIGVARPGVAVAATRPPFFSIDHPLVQDWRFNLRVRGERFMRVQTPFFNGRLSADIQLLGTFAEPMMIGEANIHQGVVVFPFANIRLDNASIRLSLRDPYDPQLNALGHARTMGYDIQMDASGSAYDPIIRFTSTPPLSQDAILLLLTAGILPGDDGDGTGAAAMGRLAIFVGAGLAGDLFAGTGDGWTRDLTVESLGRSSATGRERFRIEYRISDDFALVGENDEFDDYNAGIRWRFYSR